MLSGQYEMTIKTRPLFVADDQTAFGEMFDGVLRCHFRDDEADLKALTLQLRSDASSDDEGRMNTSSEYHTDKQIDTNFSTTRHPYIRHSVNFTALAGFFGSFFQAKITKTMPVDGNFKYYGIDINVIPRPELDAEFLFGGQTVWTT